MATPTLIVIAGPTAVGKTKLAVNWAKQLSCEILSADSRQFFEELSIGTAKPTTEEMQGVPHHFIGHKTISENYTAGEFEKDALATLSGCFAKQNYAILVGGSGLYLDAVCHGIDNIPKASDEVRTELNSQAKKGLSPLLQELQQKDPKTYQRIDRQNPVRVVRALEVIRTTGKPYSSFLNRPAKERPFALKKYCLYSDRKLLYHRINHRVDSMMKQGLLDEVKTVYPYRGKNALKTVGYKELFEYLDGKNTLEESVERIKQHTRNYAKRQLTWFRRDNSYTWLEINSEQSLPSLPNLI